MLNLLKKIKQWYMKNIKSLICTVGKKEVSIDIITGPSIYNFTTYTLYYDEKYNSMALKKNKSSYKNSIILIPKEYHYKLKKLLTQVIEEYEEVNCKELLTTLRPFTIVYQDYDNPVKLQDSSLDLICINDGKPLFSYALTVNFMNKKRQYPYFSIVLNDDRDRVVFVNLFSEENFDLIKKYYLYKHNIEI